MKKLRDKAYFIATMITITMLLSACGSSTQAVDIAEDDFTETDAAESSSEPISLTQAMDINPDVIGWLYVPDTEINYPILCSYEAVDFYDHHDASGAESETGAAHIEYYNLPDMSDFNTIIYGKTDETGNKGLFADLYKFTDEAFFDEHEDLYIYKPEGTLIYKIVAAYERPISNIMADYDTTAVDGCQEYLDREYETHQMSGNYRVGWEGITPYHYLVSLSTRLGDGAGKQYIVLALLVSDPNGLVNRQISSPE